ncbi:hypothetical protein K474DRAFT_1602437, partial [Panus rudis PR-1116 ss-1]
EIFRFLNLQDLLNLSRVSKDFRAFLLNRTKAATVWRIGRENIEGMPEPPPTMSDPYVAHMLVDSFCQVRLM